MANPRRSKIETLVAALVKYLGCTPRDAVTLLWASAKHEAAEKEIKSYYMTTFVKKKGDRF